MTSDPSWPWWAIFPVISLIVGAGAIIGLILFYFSREPKKRGPIVECSACGRMYHKDWGGICPDCSGAD